MNSTKSRRKKVTIIRKKKQRDGSITTTKHTVYGVTVSQAQNMIAEGDPSLDNNQFGQQQQQFMNSNN